MKRKHILATIRATVLTVMLVAVFNAEARPIESAPMNDMVVTVDTIAALRDISRGKLVKSAQVLGYYEPGDGGGGPERHWVTSPSAGKYVDNGGSIIVPTGGNGSAAWILEEKTYTAKQFGAKGDGVTNDYTRLVAAAAAMPASGGKFIFDAGGSFYIAGNGKYVTFAGTDLTIAFEKDAKLITQNSDNPEYTGTPYYSGLIITATNTELVNPRIRGGLISWNGEVMNVWGGKFWNLHNVAISPSNRKSFEKLAMYGTEFNTSVDTPGGDFTVIQRGGTDDNRYLGKLAIFDGCKFIGVAGGVNIHSLEKLIVRGCQFLGGKQNRIKISRDIGTSTEHDVIIENNLFDGTPVDAMSSNIHLNSSPYYVVFVDFWRSFVFKGNTVQNYATTTTAGINFVNSTLVNTSNLIEGNTFISVNRPIKDICGLGIVKNNKFYNCGANAVNTGGIGVWSQQIIIEDNFLKDSQIRIGNTGALNSAEHKARYFVRKNNIEYGADDNGAIQYYNTSPLPTFWPEQPVIEDNNIIVTNSKARGIYTDLTYPYAIGTDNNVTGATVKGSDIDYMFNNGKWSGYYTFDKQGGATGVYGIGIILPKNTTITKASYEVIEPLTSNGPTRIQVGVQAIDATGILADTAYDDVIFTEGSHDAIPDGKFTNYTTKTTTSGRLILFKISNAPLTSGKIFFHGDYTVSE